ncbi:MAG: group 1 truncated hemoglobin [Chloroflexales bacterium]|nr:group 1 truncated hemoglobin [Chloroflexales bacterium]
MASLFERIGGEIAVDAAVERFYQIVLADDRIRHFFDGVDMERQSAHQKAFLKFAFGGRPPYSGRSMRTVHAHLVHEKGLSAQHFDAVLEDLEQALRELDLADDLIAEAVGVAKTLKDDVLNRDA